MKLSWCVLVVLFACGGSQQQEENEEIENVKCVHRDYNFGGTVCVCNASHCDTIEPLTSFSDDEYNLYISSESGLRFNKTKQKFVTSEEGHVSVIKITVNPSIKYQKVNGFGGAFTDAAGLNIRSLSRRAGEKLLESYFSPKGIEYNIGRVPIGGTDFSTRKYSLDDIPQDTTLKNFKLSAEDLELKIPLIRQAQRLSKKEVKLIGSAWSAPPWMKTNNRFTCFGLLKPQYYDLWGQYHLKFLEEYNRNGVKFWALTTGNEPIAGLLPYYSFNCLGWTPFSQSLWVSENLGPTLKNSTFNETIIIAVDDNRYTLPFWPKILLNSEKTRKYVSGIGLHWYWDKYIPIRVLDWTHFAFPDKFLLYTEACYVKERGKPPVLLGSWNRGEGYALNIIKNMNHFVTGWVDWNMALDLKGGPTWVNNVVDSPVIVNATADEFYKQPMFYALGHFSKFVPEGSVRIDIGHTKLNAVGFLTPENNIVIIMLNSWKNPKTVQVYGSPRGIASFVLPQKSIATLIFKNLT